MSKNFIIKQFSEASNYEGDEEVIIGEIIDFSGESIGFIKYDKRIREKKGCQLCADRYENNEKESCVGITVNLTYKNLFYNKPALFEPLVMHELGHWFNGDLERNLNDNLSKSEINKENEDRRGQKIINNQIDDSELKADKFAFLECGKSRLIASIDYAIKIRKNLENDFPLYKEMAIKEYENRKKAIKKM